MGIFTDYDIDIDTVKESSFDIPDGVYLFEIAEAEILEGTPKKPDTTFFIIDYQLEDENGDAAGQKREWFTLSEDGNADTRRAKQSVSFLKSRLLGLGLKGAQLTEFDGSEIVGLTGSLQVKTVPGKNGGEFQNVRNVKLDGAADPDEVDEADLDEDRLQKPVAERKPRAKAAPKAPAKPAAKAPARKPKSEEPEDDDENPFGNEE